ncbi:MAG: Gfo/Idh/MocA family oxidoreductase [Anaerolineaceae bacterium]|nr:Gfo/Idh/MocA family oxidoreductase [Anaerolineaceae bacterium]
MSDRLRWGILGTGRINEALIAPLRMSSRNELVAVASRSLEKAQEYARNWKITKAYGSYEELLADTEVDVIYNSLPNHLHADWTIRAAQAKKHVLCEKPLALSTSEVDSIKSAASENKVVIQEAFMYRHHPQTMKVQELISSGAIGQLVQFVSTFTFILNKPEDIRSKPEAGGGSIWDLGCYPISYARLISNSQPNEVFGWRVNMVSGVDETFMGQIHFANGLVAQVSCSFCLPHYSSAIIRGTEGSIIIPNPFKPEKPSSITLQQGEKEKTLNFSSKNLYLGEVEDMADAILNNKPPRVTLDDSRENVATIAALLESAHLQRAVVV